MGLLAPRQAEMAEAVVSWSRLRSRIAMIDSLALAQEVSRYRRPRSGSGGVDELHRRDERRTVNCARGFWVRARAPQGWGPPTALVDTALETTYGPRGDCAV
jgi:hypothetical protein